jgi:hypothetical protein
MTEKAADRRNQTRTRLCFPALKRIKKFAKSFGQRLFRHRPVDGPKVSAKMDLQLAVHFSGHGITPERSPATMRGAKTLGHTEPAHASNTLSRERFRDPRTAPRATCRRTERHSPRAMARANSRMDEQIFPSERFHEDGSVAELGRQIFSRVAP